MNRCANGKVTKMSKEEIAKARERFFNRQNSRKDISAYEDRIKELENTVVTLLDKLSNEE